MVVPGPQAVLQLTPRGLQPGSLAFSCMAVALIMYEHPGKALVLIHSQANLEKAGNYNTIVKTSLWASVPRKSSARLRY